jgi:predicted phosphoribosyltransferase
MAVGMHYVDFGQTPDEEVVRILAAPQSLSDDGREADDPGEMR